MLVGEYPYSLDDKGRVFVPARWREELSEGVVITWGPERFLYVMPRARFVELASRLKELSITQKDIRDYNRLFFGKAQEEQMDKQGRIAIPQRLRDYAGLTKEVVLTGVSDQAEIWDRVAWESYEGEMRNQYPDIAEKLRI